MFKKKKIEKLLIALICLAALGIAGPAQAAPITFEIGQNNSWELGTGWGGSNSTLGYSTSIDPNLSSQSFSLNQGGSFLFNFGTFTLDELDGSISPSETNTLTLTAILDFDLPAGVNLVNNPGNAVAIEGNIVDYVDGHCSDGTNKDQTACLAPNTNTWIAAVAAHCSDNSGKNQNQCTTAGYNWVPRSDAHCSDSSGKNQNQCLAPNTKTWIAAAPEQYDLTITFDPVHVQFSNGGQFTVALSDTIFWTNDTKTVTATVTLDTAPTIPGGNNDINTVPEPATFVLLGAGLMAVGLTRKGIKR